MSGAFLGPLVDRDICSETGMFLMMMNGYRALTRVLIFATALVLGADPQAGTAEAKSVVEKLHTTLLDVMKRADALGYSGRYDTLAPVVSASFDFDTIGQQLLGRYWAGLNADQRKLFVETFKQLSTATYAARFDGFKNETFRTVSQETKGDWTIVTAELVKSNGDTVQFKYILKPDRRGLADLERVRRWGQRARGAQGRVLDCDEGSRVRRPDRPAQGQDRPLRERGVTDPHSAHSLRRGSRWVSLAGENLSGDGYHDRQ